MTIVNSGLKGRVNNRLHALLPIRFMCVQNAFGSLILKLAMFSDVF